MHDGVSGLTALHKHQRLLIARIADHKLCGRCVGAHGPAIQLKGHAPLWNPKPSRPTVRRKQQNGRRQVRCVPRRSSQLP